MPLTSLRRNGKRILLGGGGLLLGGGCLLFVARYGLFALFLLLIAWDMPKDNDVPAKQLTVVQGTVTSATTGRPLPGVRLAIEASVPHTRDYEPSGAVARTDAQGKYNLRFYNEQGRYYRVSLDCQESDTSFTPARYAFDPVETNSDDFVPENERQLTLGRPNKVDFKPKELRIVAMRVRNRNTGYRFWQLPEGYRVLTSNRDTTVYLALYSLPATGIKIRYNTSATAADTAIAVVLQNPTALFPDTVRATLTFVR